MSGLLAGLLAVTARAPAAPVQAALGQIPARTAQQRPHLLTARGSASMATMPGEAPVRAARATSVDDTGHLLLQNASGAILRETGPVSGTLPGRVKVRLVVHATVTASFTIEARGGSISGYGSAVLHSARQYSSFGGSLSVNRGTGRYAHAAGGGQLYGVIDRIDDALTVQTVGQLHY